MDKKDILKKVDHTLLGQTATWDDIRGILDDIKTSTGFSTAGATFADVELMKKYIGKDVKLRQQVEFHPSMMQKNLSVLAQSVLEQAVLLRS